MSNALTNHHANENWKFGDDLNIYELADCYGEELLEGVNLLPFKEIIEDFLNLPCAIVKDEDIEKHKEIRKKARDVLTSNPANKKT